MKVVNLPHSTLFKLMMFPDSLEVRLETPFNLSSQLSVVVESAGYYETINLAGR